ncbi:MAG: IreB family regulatory phosphoprotein [Defluviitaleaceae bacterium]|nr:IreB family regulatory phosphoprotein [Defluviitaleaceae bacterium]
MADKEAQEKVRSIIREVTDALTEKGYTPLIQFVGYILSGDPTYITAFKGARSLIGKVERDVLLEEFIRFYLQNNAAK